MGLFNEARITDSNAFNRTGANLNDAPKEPENEDGWAGTRVQAREKGVQRVQVPSPDETFGAPSALANTPFADADEMNQAIASPKYEASAAFRALVSARIKAMVEARRK